MLTKDEIADLLTTLKKWRESFFDFKDKIADCAEGERKRELQCGIYQYFLDFHNICEQFICMELEHLNLLNKKEYSHLGAMKEIRDKKEISNNFFNFYSKSIILKALLQDDTIHIVPKCEELFLNLSSNIDTIDELDIVIRELGN